MKVLVGSGQELVIGYDAAANQLYVDRSKADGFAGRGRGGRGGAAGESRATLPDSARGKPVKLRVLVDRSAVEVFADGGRAMAFFVYPIQSNELGVAAAPGDESLKLIGLGGLTVGGRALVNYGPNGPLGPVESLTVTSIGTPAANVSLAAPAAAGDADIKLGGVANITPGRRLTIGVGAEAESVTVASAGTAASSPTALFAPAAAGDRNIKLASTAGITEGSMVSLDAGAGVEMLTVASGGVGSAGRTLTLAAPAAAGASNIKVISLRGGFGFGGAGAGVEIGVPVNIVSNQPGGGIEMFAIGGAATVTSLDVWQMRSAW